MNALSSEAATKTGSGASSGDGETIRIRASETETDADDENNLRKITPPTLRPTNVPIIPEADTSKGAVHNEPPSSSILQPLNLIPNHQLREHDYFSDSWIITREKFLNLERRRLGIVEDACFVAIGSGGSVYPSSKMFVDWTDFMVEHMSKWWNELRILQDSDSAMFDLALSYFAAYIEKVFASKNKVQPSTFHETIAVVAFAPYRSGRHTADRGHQLTVHSLAATLASLHQVGFGRVVIAGYGQEDQRHVAASLKFLAAQASSSSNHHDIVPDPTMSTTQIKIDNTEFGFAKVNQEDWISTQWVKFNMPRGAVIGLQEALMGKIPEKGQDGNDAAVTCSPAWLGTTHDASYWKYVYLTEPDTILHTKLELLPAIRKGLDDGLSFFPHRLQPIPHGSDLPSGRNADAAISSDHSGRFVPNHILPFSNVTIMLDPTDTVDDTTTKDTDEGSVGVTAYYCCDAGPSPEHENCGTWWWTCGFHDGFVQATMSQEEALEKHKRLAMYPMMRLKQGTGVVFGPTEHGRKCVPSKDPCPQSNDNQ
ncbi:unnamed protein product [Cylindrotheca closterium]|uniref:Uncharacterized protein n=1 Tax=Cylindrotheca closterium TaxID=2856 RepID=A0AAD2FHT9_9STRA|nr:unnamed protein product [Cylindrotheca closterium]